MTATLSESTPLSNSLVVRKPALCGTTRTTTHTGMTLTGGTLSAARPLPIPHRPQPKSVRITLESPHSLKAIMFQDIPLDSSPDDTDSDWDDCIDPPYEAPQNPDTPRYHAPTPDSDEDDEAHAQMVPRRKPGGYDSRIEQILYENPELPILITDAGKSLESGGRYIVYTIRTGVSLLVSLATLAHLADSRIRISRFGVATLNSPLYAMRCVVSTLLLLSRPFLRSIPWPTTLPTPPTRSKTSKLLTCASACLLYS